LTFNLYAHIIALINFITISYQLFTQNTTRNNVDLGQAGSTHLKTTHMLVALLPAGSITTS